MTKTVEEAVNELRTRGISIARWSRQNKFKPSLVYQVLRSGQIPLHGESHKIAVLLGIKDGIVESDESNSNDKLNQSR